MALIRALSGNGGGSGGGELLMSYSLQASATYPTLSIDKSGTLRVRITAGNVNYVNNSQVKKNGTAVNWISKDTHISEWIVTDYEFSVSSGDTITFVKGGNEVTVVIVATLDMELPTPSHP